MLATVPTRQSSSGPGLSVSAFRCSRTPTGRFAFAAAIGNFQPVDDGALVLHGKRAVAANNDVSGFEGYLKFVRCDAGKREAKREPVGRLVEIDGRLPAGRFGRADLEELTLQPLRASEQLQRFGPHPRPRIAIFHASPSYIACREIFPHSLTLVKWGLGREEQARECARVRRAVCFRYKGWN